MKINRITATNFIGLHHVDVVLEAPVTVFAGKNGAGKSSLRDAIRFALLGEPGRVRLKRDQGDLITRGAKTGSVRIETDQGAYEAKLKQPVPARDLPDALPYVLDAQRFAGLDSKERRRFLSDLLGVQAKPTDIARMAEERGCDMMRYETVKPLLRSGFDAAHQDCKTRATEAKGAWRAITGETWGAAKAVSWRPDAPTVDINSLDEEAVAQRAEIGRLDAQIATARVRAGQSDQRKRMRAQADMAPELEVELAETETRLHGLQAKAQQLRDAKGPGGQMSTFSCPDCGTVTRVRIDRGTIVPVPDDAKDPVIDQTAVTSVEAEISQTEHHVERIRRLLAQSQHAADTLAEASAEHGDETASVEDLEAEREINAKQLEDIRHRIDVARKAVDAEKRAAAAHDDVNAWATLAEALAPDGIPGELLARTIQPINNRLRESSSATGWAQVSISAEMEIAADGARYELLSESEQWRVDAMLAEAIAHLSGLRMLVLDRMDVLDVSSRGACLAWLSGIGGSDHDTVIVMATMKSAPVGYADNVTGVWIEGGRIANAEKSEAA